MEVLGFQDVCGLFGDVFGSVSLLFELRAGVFKLAGGGFAVVEQLLDFFDEAAEFLGVLLRYGVAPVIVDGVRRG